MSAVVHDTHVEIVISAWKMGINVDEASQLSPIVREGVKALREHQQEPDFDPCSILTPEFFTDVITEYSQF